MSSSTQRDIRLSVSCGVDAVRANRHVCGGENLHVYPTVCPVIYNYGVWRTKLWLNRSWLCNVPICIFAKATTYTSNLLFSCYFSWYTAMVVNKMRSGRISNVYSPVLSKHTAIYFFTMVDIISLWQYVIFTPPFSYKTRLTLIVYTIYY